MLVRHATPNDAPAIAALRERTIRTIVAPLKQYSSDEIESWAANFTAERVEGLIQQGHYLVAEADGEVVGIGRLVIDSPGHALIRGVFVDSNCVGQGIGSRIVKQLIDIAMGLDVRTIELVATLNARSFYERLGFQFLGQIRHPTTNGAIIPGLHMRMEIAGAAASLQ